MPDDHLARPHGWRIAVAGFVALAVYLVAAHVVLVHPRADMRSAVGWISGELIALCALWSMRGGSLPLRAVLTACIGLPLWAVVLFLGVFGDMRAEDRWVQAPANLHAWWLFLAVAWSIVAGLIVPTIRAVYRAIRRYCARSE
jgi:hypothetical protein